MYNKNGPLRWCKADAACRAFLVGRALFKKTCRVFLGPKTHHCGWECRQRVTFFFFASCLPWLCRKNGWMAPFSVLVTGKNFFLPFFSILALIFKPSLHGGFQTGGGPHAMITVDGRPANAHHRLDRPRQNHCAKKESCASAGIISRLGLVQLLHPSPPAIRCPPPGNKKLSGPSTVGTVHLLQPAGHVVGPVFFFFSSFFLYFFIYSSLFLLVSTVAQQHPPLVPCRRSATSLAYVPGPPSLPVPY